MKDVRFYGVVGTIDVDITFRTDAISQDDENFNVTQVTVGPQFQTTDKSDDDHVALFNGIKEVNHTLTDMKDLASSIGTALSIADSDGENLVVLREELDSSDSI